MRTRQRTSSSDPVPYSHQSVLLNEVMEAFVVEPSDTIIDATLGNAGHAQSLVSLLGKEGTFIGIDADGSAIKRAEVELKNASTKKVYLVHDNFRNIDDILKEHEIEHVDACLFDLGWRSEQLHSGRGFSFRNDEPLLMTYADTVGENALTARRIVNEWEETHILDILRGWGEERYARKIAAAIVAARASRLIETSRELAEIVANAVPARERGKRIHPATKTFQALRMAVNDEMGALGEALEVLKFFMNSGGRVVVITFHSIEDRFVKRLFRKWQNEQLGTARKKIKPSAGEIEKNPRARSALLRTFEFE